MLPEDVYGGLPETGLARPGPIVVESVLKFVYWRSGLRKAFDRARPLLALRVMQHMGLDAALRCLD